MLLRVKSTMKWNISMKQGQVLQRAGIQLPSRRQEEHWCLERCGGIRGEGGGEREEGRRRRGEGGGEREEGRGREGEGGGGREGRREGEGERGRERGREGDGKG